MKTSERCYRAVGKFDFWLKNCAVFNFSCRVGGWGKKGQVSPSYGETVVSFTAELEILTWTLWLAGAK